MRAVLATASAPRPAAFLLLDLDGCTEVNDSLGHHAGLDEAEMLAQRLRELILQPVTVEGVRLHVCVSIGVAGAPVPAATVEELLRPGRRRSPAARAAGRSPP